MANIESPYKKGKKKMNCSRTNKFFESDSNFKSFENTEDTFFTNTLDSNLNNNLYLFPIYNVNNCHNYERKGTMESRSNSKNNSCEKSFRINSKRSRSLDNVITKIKKSVNKNEIKFPRQSTNINTVIKL